MVLGMVLGFGFNKTKVLAAAEKYVQQGKLQNAITEYEKVSKDDPKDLTVLNTIGDLYARLGQVDKAVECFKRVGDAYGANGFTLKAIAMYKKTTKLSPGSLECIQKLGELYTQQGLYSDARAQLVQVAEHHMRKGHLDEAARIFQKLLELDPENASMQTKLAELYVKIGKSEDARNIYFRAAESLHQRGDMKKADEALHRVLALDPQNSRALALSGRIAIDAGDSAKGIALLEKLPDVDSRPDALQYLLKAYLQANRVADAQPIARKLVSVHNEPSGIMSCAEALLAADMTGSAIALFQDFADRLLAGDQQRFVQALSTATSRVKEDASQLEILRSLYAKAGDDTHTTELAELLAHACVQSGDLAKARDLYRELAEMEPDNPLHLQNYKQVLAKLGEEPISRELTQAESQQAFLVDEIEPVEKVVEQNYPDDVAALLQGALTESELFDSYNVPNKAIPPLESVLPKAPFDLRINQRLASLYARTGRYADAAKACSVLHSVYLSAGHASEADQYKEMAAKYAQKAGVATPQGHEVSAAEISPTVPQPPAPPVVVDFPEFEAGPAVAPLAEMPVMPVEPVDAGSVHEIVTGTVHEVISGSSHEVDLSDEWEQMIAGEVIEPEPVLPTNVIEMPAPAALEEPVVETDTVADLIQEIKFYIAQSMWNEAGSALGKLEGVAPDHQDLPALRNAHAAGAIIAQAQEPEIEVTAVEDASVEQDHFTVEPEIDAAVEVPSLEEESPAAPVFEIVEEVATKPEVAETAFEQPQAEEAPELVEPEPAPATKVAAKDEDVLSDFVLDLENALGDDFAIGGAKPAPPAAAAPVSAPVVPSPTTVIPAIATSAASVGSTAAAAAAPAPIADGSVTVSFDDEASSVLSDMFAEFKEELEDKTGQQEDPETHYNLGVAFKEMGLLDEAIGELQKVCSAVDRGVPFAQTMQAYTWLAHCFVEKGVPEASFKWYQRALKLPADEETRTAIHYELACAYEVANRRQEALNHFMEVYTTNIDFRDVAERIKALKS